MDQVCPVRVLLGCFRAGVFNRSPKDRCGCFESVCHSVFDLFVFANRRPKAGRKLHKRFGNFLILRSVRWTSFGEFVTLRPSFVFVLKTVPNKNQARLLSGTQILIDVFN